MWNPGEEIGEHILVEKELLRIKAAQKYTTRVVKQWPITHDRRPPCRMSLREFLQWCRIGVVR